MSQQSVNAALRASKFAATKRLDIEVAGEPIGSPVPQLEGPTAAEGVCVT